MPDDSSQALGIVVRAALIIPAALAAAGADLGKYRAWRERCVRWRREGRQPPPEYLIDNRLWRLRLTALALGAVTFFSLVIYLFIANAFHPWVFWFLYTLCMVGCGIWGLLAQRVR